ncbi:oligosaccharide flippase family protein [Limosilactobacillus reuteri]|uniref:Polysaccharide biosynthesis protein n=1 Tax=Limosilactobacillus reuteri subsp. rodentium (strain DSM 17509 / CIP 109821 / 100-23) TaxID=349123 RepID=B3XNV8_LIMR1|nr:polysaccharide biosynthesis C-terminal domain-containing protein [Limosilactobacillus reuteri]EDX42766.1 polysaccharide biosynthesis protein [Limosilactobacillus reuteri subsp. rodentium]MCC4476660.1 polysaccharide biosynthesis C-terminal domain-containing protein [Limosilactobacillus reuteri]
MKVIKNYLYNVVYQILVLLVPLITVPYVSRVLGPDLVGINSYTNSWMTFFLLVGQMGIALYGNREVAYHRENPIERSQIFWGIELLQVMTIMSALITYLIAVFLFSTTFKEYFLLQSLWIIAAGVDVSWYFMGMENFQRIVFRNMLVKLTSVVLIFLLIKGHDDLGKYIALLGLSNLIGNLTLWPYLRDEIKWVPIRTWHPFKHFYPALLLFIPTITTQVYQVVNRLMLGRMSTQNQLGQFQNADQIIKVVLAIATASGQVMLPHIANKFSKGDIRGIRESLYNSFDFITAIAVPMMFGVMAIAEPFAPWFLGSEFNNAGRLMMIEAPIILFIGWSNVTGTQYLMPISRTKEYTISVTIGAVVNVITNFLFIAKWGANGAALATSISEFSVTAVQLMYIKSTIRRRQLFNTFWKYLVSGLFMFFIVNRLANIIKMNIGNLVLEVVLGIMVYMLCLFILHAPIIAQAQALVTNYRKNK